MNSKQSRDNKNGLHRLIDILNNPEKEILPLLFPTGVSTQNEDVQGDCSEHCSDRNKNQTVIELLDISKTLFADIEILGKQYNTLHERGKMPSLRDESEFQMELITKRTMSSTTLSGLPEMHVPPEMAPTDADLPETLFGQVELQTTALAKLVKKFTRRVAKIDNNTAESNKICVLDIGIVYSDCDNNDNNEHDESDDVSDNQSMIEGYVDSGCFGKDDDSDEEEQRMRLRMERAMENADEEYESCNEKSEDFRNIGNAKPDDQIGNVELYDPVVEDLRDGFFDLVEMEEFADEEEDYLPSAAFDQTIGRVNTNAKKLNKEKSFHQRQREGLTISTGSDNSDEESDVEEMFENVKEVKRKKYRDQEDIDALYNLYQDTNMEESDNDDNIVNMSAADFFGKPKKKYIEKYKKKHLRAKMVSDTVTKNGDGENDSWGEYDFEKENQEDWRGGDNDSCGHDDELEDMKGPSTNGVQQEAFEALQKEANDVTKSTNQEERLRRQTEELELELIDEKPWQMRGESKSTSRPTNSLLEGTPEFEMASKQAPVISIEYTVDLEEVIKRRILAEDWDDVVPRELPDIGWNKKRGETPEVSQEKSILGLGELYEREYLKKAVGFDKDAMEKQTEEDKAKDEMKQLFANLCSKLDALSNYHFAPRPINDEAEARPVTVPAIAMEEVLPLHVSDARGIAPEEVFATKRGRGGILRDNNELDQTERKRQRQSKKAARRKARKEKEADEKMISRLQPGLGLNNPYEKRKAREELSFARTRGKVTTGEKEMDTKFGQSGTFFKRLQAEAQQIVHNDTSEKFRDPGKTSKPGSSTFKL